MRKPMSCRFGLHRWIRGVTEDGTRYARCGRCGKDDDQGNAHWLAGGS